MFGSGVKYVAVLLCYNTDMISGREVGNWADPELLASSGLAVQNPAEMVQFDSLEQFRDGANNFPNFFRCQNIGEHAQRLIQGRQVFQRFRLVFPFETFYLQEVVSTPSWFYDVQVWRELFDAYATMSRLVDTADENVSRDGAVDSLYLVR